MQTIMKLNSHGGKRKNCGRTRLRSKGVAHRVREKVSSRTPMHINFRYSERVRNKDSLRLLKKAISNARRHGLRILHFSFQSNHIHLIVEASSNEILSRSMRSLTITFAMGLNRGRIQVERYHLHVLKSLRETRNAIYYVLFNQQKHERGTSSTIDEYSSVLSVAYGIDLVRLFAKRSKMTLKIGHSKWYSDRPMSWLMKNALSSEIVRSPESFSDVQSPYPHQAESRP